jgi:bacterioferritin (cytochrome b1)
LTGLYTCDLVYPHTSESGITSDRNYELQLSYWLPDTAKEYGHAENEIDNILLLEKESGDAVLLYEIDERYTVTKDLQEFLQRDYELEQYLTCELPENFTLGEFQKDMSFCGGWLLEGDVEETLHDEEVEESWYCPGGIGRGENASEILKFESGTLTDVSLLMNHTEQFGETEILEDCETQAVLAEYAFDLFTASGWGEYLSQHPEAEEAVPESHYWYVFFGNEDSEIFYVLFLNQEYFNKEDVVRMAQSVQFTEEAF